MCLRGKANTRTWKLRSSGEVISLSTKIKNHDKMKRINWLLSLSLFCYASVYAQGKTQFDLRRMLAENKLMIDKSHKLEALRDAERNGITCNNNVWLKNIDFEYGTINVDIRGRNEFLNSFPGIAFHASDTSANYEVVYFRPFNFRSSDPVRRTWSVQYMSLPEYPFDRLRKESPGQFEHEILPDPKPEDWIHARIVVQKDSITVYVNGMATPSLVTKCLGKRGNGMISLWTDQTTADFANLTITNIR